MALADMYSLEELRNRMGGRKTLHGLYIPTNKEKYVGNVNNITFRSSWERHMMVYLDHNPSVLKWASEEIIIPYISILDNQQHRYFPDFWCMVKSGSGTKQFIIEIKPEKETKPPKKGRGKNAQAVFNEAIATYAKNQCKWAAANEFCKKRNIEFKIITEKSLKL